MVRCSRLAVEEGVRPMVPVCLLETVYLAEGGQIPEVGDDEGEALPR